jgi:hypothetical protein
MLQGCLLWSDTVRIEIDAEEHISLDLSDPEGLGCISCFSSMEPMNHNHSISHLFLIDQLIDALQMISKHNHQHGVYLQFSSDRAKFINLQHEYMTQDIPICDYRPLHKFHHIAFPTTDYISLHYPSAEWNHMIQTFCIFAGSRGSPLQYHMDIDKDKRLITLHLHMTTDAGHSVDMNIKCKAANEIGRNLGTSDIQVDEIPFSSCTSSSLHGQVCLHNLLNSCRLTTTSPHSTLLFHRTGIYQQITPFTPPPKPAFPYQTGQQRNKTQHGPRPTPEFPYYIHMFYVSVPDLDPSSFS